MINGARTIQLKQFVDKRGKVMKMLRSDSKMFTGFGEVYFSVVNPGAVKAWKMHFRIAQNITVPSGRLRLVLYDNRKGSMTFGKVDIIDAGEDNYVLIHIPPLVWYGFTCISSKAALIVNCIDHPYDPSEVKKTRPDSKVIPYNWKKSK
jgi:dTDP-4-dehydrorhamnose 3,5-epimerase